MTIDIGARAEGVGSVVEWISVWIAFGSAVVTFGAAAATVWVALLAHKTSRRAAEIADEAKGIARQQHAEAVQKRESNARIVGRLLVHEISELPINLHILRERCKRVISRGRPSRENDIEFLEDTLRIGISSFMPGAEKSEERLHNLPEAIGNDVAELVGYSRTLNAMSKELLDLIQIRHVENSHPSSIKVFAGDIKDIEALVKYVEKFSRHSMPTVEKMRVFVGAELRDLSRFDVDKSDVDRAKP